MSGAQFNPLLQALAQAQGEKSLDVYANSIRMGATLNDFIVAFGLALDQPIGNVTQKDVAIIRMAPRSAKSLMLNLIAALEAYEDVMGEIKMPVSSHDDMTTVKNSIRALYEGMMNAKTHISSVSARYPTQNQ